MNISAPASLWFTGQGNRYTLNKDEAPDAGISWVSFTYVQTDEAISVPPTRTRGPKVFDSFITGHAP
jgi:hypothetical protein